MPFPSGRLLLDARGYMQFNDLWNGPLGVTGQGVAGNECFAPTCGARYLSRSNSHLDSDTTRAVSKLTVAAGLLAPDDGALSVVISITKANGLPRTPTPAEVRSVKLLAPGMAK